MLLLIGTVGVLVFSSLVSGDLSCALRDHEIEGTGLFINAIEFAKKGALRRSCATPDCSHTDRFGTIDSEACSVICSMVSECVAWTYEDREYDGFCRLLSKNEKTNKKQNSIAGVKECSMSEWPECIQKDVAYMNYDRGEALWFDGTIFGSHHSEGCFMNDCTYTDKIIVTDVAACGRLCHKVPDCKYWTFGTEEGLNKCWLRLTDTTKGRIIHSQSGSATCGSFAPVPPSRWTDGENKCWGGGFNAELCCDQRHGPQGNAACWDAHHTFAMCCLGEKPDWATDLLEA
jgi:hypothetical protein